jgi:hypothetical protein
MSLHHIFSHMMVAPFESFHILIIQHYFYANLDLFKMVPCLSFCKFGFSSYFISFIEVWVSVH